MSDPGEIDDLVLLSGCLGRVTVAGRRFEVTEPCLRDWTAFARDIQHLAVSFLAGALTVDASRPAEALAFFSGPAAAGFRQATRAVMAACLRSERTGRHPTPKWIGSHARPRDLAPVLRVVADRTTTGDTLDRTVRAFFGIPPRADDGGVDRRDEKSGPGDWGFANTFDLLASEYGWSRDRILDLTLTQVRRIADAIAARYRRQRPDGGDAGCDDDEAVWRGDAEGRIDHAKLRPINVTADPTWQIGVVDPDAGPWDSVPEHVAEKFRRAGYTSMMDYHRQGRAKVEKAEAEERARVAAGKRR